jgi:hypothetical protein
MSASQGSRCQRARGTATLYHNAYTLRRLGDLTKHSNNMPSSLETFRFSSRSSRNLAFVKPALSLIYFGSVFREEVTITARWYHETLLLMGTSQVFRFSAQVRAFQKRMDNHIGIHGPSQFFGRATASSRYF